jgi:hypothetical protein
MSVTGVVCAVFNVTHSCKISPCSMLVFRLKRECSAVGGSRELLKRWVQGHALFVTVSCAAANFDWKEEQISEETLVRFVPSIVPIKEL